MSVPMHSRYQLLWYKAAYGIIADSLQEKLNQALDDDELTLHLLWRLGNVEYRAGRFSRSIDHYERLLKMVEDGIDAHGHKIKRLPNPDQNYKSRIHQHIGRSYMQIFLMKQKHEQLDKAYEHYRYAVDHMIAALDAMIELPNLLLEFGRVSEYYGAFEASMEIYTKIITNFPTFRGYFDVLYRLAIVGKHLATLSSNPKEVEETVEKTLDILHFLLEALPTNIYDVHIVLLYARTFEMSKTLQIKYRAPAIYTSLFELCKKQKILDAHQTDEKSWLANPMTWFKLAEKIESEHEYLIAKDAYNKFIDEAKRRAQTEKDLSEILDINACLKLTKHFAKYQNYHEAIRYGDIGLKVDRYNKELRSLMAQWSPKHRDLLKKDVEALQKITNLWKGRCWTFGFVKRLKEFTLQELETRYAKNRYDKECRRLLAYYARDKYRSIFYFEDICATRIQHAFRHHRKMWVWQEAQRRHIGNQASELHHRYSKKPFQTILRAEVLALISHRHMPRKHPLHLTARQILQENKALKQIVRCIKAYQVRNALHTKIEERKAKLMLEFSKYVIRIQAQFRRIAAKKRMEQQRKIREQQIHAAIKLQRCWKRLSSKPEYIERKNMRRQMRLRNRAMLTFRKRLLPLMKRYIRRKRRRADKLNRRSKRSMKKTVKSYTQQDVLDAAIKIQRFYRKCVANFWMKVSRRALVGRRQVGYSHIVSSQLPAMDMLLNEQVRYHNPGIDGNSPAFQRLLFQHTVLCFGFTTFDARKEFDDVSSSSEKMTQIDYQLLSLVLRQPNCGIRRIVLHNCDFSDPRKIGDSMDVFIQALSKCTSIQSLWILGGNWSAKFIQLFYKIVQVENPRIKEFCFEKITLTGQHADLVGQCGGRLLMDYFNYTIPALNVLSLHGCTLRDDQIDLIIQGLQVNTAIRKLDLSLNFISDQGFINIFQAMNYNKKSFLEKLDLSFNLITCNQAVKDVLSKYRTKKHQKCLLEINLANNRIASPFDAMESAFLQRISPQLVVRYVDFNTRKSEFFTSKLSSMMQKSLDSSDTSSFNDDSTMMSSEDSIISGPKFSSLAGSAMVTLKGKKKGSIIHKRKRIPPLYASNSANLDL